MKKVTVKASSDIALVKYWGKNDPVLRLPENGSISILLDGLDTVTTVEFREALEADQFIISGETIVTDSREAKRVVKHLDRIRAIAQEQGKKQVRSLLKLFQRTHFLEVLDFHQ